MLFHTAARIRVVYLLALVLVAVLAVGDQFVVQNSLAEFGTLFDSIRNQDDPDDVMRVEDVTFMYRTVTAPHLRQLRIGELALLGITLLVLVAEGLFIFEPLIRKIRRQLRELDEKQHAVEHARDEAQAANRVKSAFLANMSHEIRTPMNGVLGLTELMLQTEINSQQREYLGMVRQSARSLLTLLNDILDLSKIEAGRLDLETTTFDLTECVEGAMRLLGLAASEKGLRLQQRLAPGLSPKLLGDPNRLRQVLVNLLGNAVKFTARGEVVVGVEQVWRRDLAAELHFSVRDTGVGIPADKQALVFEAFRQADSSTSRRFGGTGLGLSICQQLVHMMGGQIWVESEVGRGTTFHFTAALGIAQRPAVAELSPPAALLDAPVFVAASDPTERQARVEMLKQWSLRPSAGNDRAAAVAELRRAAKAGHPYCLVVADEAFTFAEGDASRGDPGVIVPPVIAIASPATGEAVEPSGAKIPQETWRDVAWRLTPPVEPWLLLQAVETVLDAATPVPVSVPLPRRDANERVPRRHVLLVDDGLVNQTVAVGLLKRRGHVVVAAGHGGEALEALARQPFDVVLMDVQMPVMDGLEATRAIREQEISTGRHQRIVAMTAGATSEERTACTMAGMDDFLSKPIDPLELYRVVESAPALVSASITG